MTVAKIDFAERARALVGTPFRPQGRCRDGLDCVGLMVTTYGFENSTVRANYRLSGDHRSEIERIASVLMRKVKSCVARSGDALLFQPAPNQLHFAVKTETGLVHADARLRRVVERPGEPQWPLVGVYRARRIKQKEIKNGNAGP